MSKLEQALQELFPSNDPLDAPDFDPVSYINSQFPNEQSLSGIELVQANLKEQYSSVTSEISQLVREQANLRESAMSQLSSSKNTINDLQGKIQIMRKKAETSEEMVEEICQDIRSLDIAKKNLTKVVSSLKRLGMLTHGIEQLELVCEKKQYRVAAALLNATNDLLSQFEECKNSPSLISLKKRRDHIISELRLQVLEDFREMENTSSEILAEACICADELGEETRDDVCTYLSSHFLEPYQKLFQLGEMHSGFENVDRRYAWLKRCLRDIKDNHLDTFPSHWGILSLIAREFCEMTKTHFIGLLERGDMDTSGLVVALQKTMQFEQEMNKRFSVNNLQMKNIEPVILDRTLGGYESVSYVQPPQKSASVPKFIGVISICFNPFLSRFCEDEERNLRESVDKFINEDDFTEGTVLPSSIRLFTMIKQTFNKCLTFSTGKILNDLCDAFKRVLQLYAEKLISKLPKADRPVKLADGEEKMISFTINTAEYSRNTIVEMETIIRAKLETQYDVEFYPELNAFLDLAGRGIQSLILGIDTKMESHFNNMTKLNWVLEGVGDKSEYIVKLSECVLVYSKNVASVLNEDYYVTFLNKLAETINMKLVTSIYKCKRIGEFGAQQILLDCFELKTKFLTLQPKNSSFSSIVNRLFHKTEGLLKILSSPPERVQENYFALIDNPNQQDFEKLLGIMGLKKSDHQWDTFTKPAKKLFNFN